jgi:hypothetical protein
MRLEQLLASVGSSQQRRSDGQPNPCPRQGALAAILRSRNLNPGFATGQRGPPTLCGIAISRPASVARRRSERQAASVATVDRDGHRDNGRGSWPRPWSAEGCGGEASQDELEAERRACGS